MAGVYRRTVSCNAKSHQERDSMFRTFHYTITDEQAGQTIGEFLRSCGYSRHILTRLKQTKNGILLDGRPALTNHRLREGEHLSIRLQEAAVDAQRARNIAQVEQSRIQALAVRAAGDPYALFLRGLQRMCARGR